MIYVYILFPLDIKGNTRVYDGDNTFECGVLFFNLFRDKQMYYNLEWIN